MTSTLYASIASSKVIEACFVHSRGCLSWILSVTLPELMTSWCLTLRTGRKSALVDNGGFPLQAEMYWSWSSLHIPAGYHMGGWPSLTVIWIYSHPIEYCFLFLLLPAVIRTILKCASWVILLVAAMAALWWTYWCLHPCCLPETDGLGVMPGDLPGLVPFSPAWGVLVAMICWYRIGEQDDNEKMWEVLRNIYFATNQNGISNYQVARYTQVKSYCIWLQIAGVSNHSAICNKSVRLCLFVYQNS